jgi:hypothetical protein
MFLYYYARVRDSSLRGMIMNVVVHVLVLVVSELLCARLAPCPFPFVHTQHIHAPAPEPHHQRC